jgi:hypothetical protein
MVRHIASLVSLLLGIGAGVLLLIMNPLFLVGRLPASDGSSLLSYRYSSAVDPGPGPLVARLLGRDNNAAGADPALRYSDAAIVLLPATAGSPAALAVRVSALSTQNSLLRARLGTLDYWNIQWPAEGGLFAAGYSNYWKLAGDTFVAGDDGPAGRYDLAALPPATAGGGITGASGRYAGASGQLRESIIVGDRPPERSVELEIHPAGRR